MYVIILAINKEDNTMMDIIRKLSWKHLLLAAALLFAYSVCDGLVERVASHASVLGLVCNLDLCSLGVSGANLSTPKPSTKVSERLKSQRQQRRRLKRTDKPQLVKRKLSQFFFFSYCNKII